MDGSTVVGASWQGGHAVPESPRARWEHRSKAADRWTDSRTDRRTGTHTDVRQTDMTLCQVFQSFLSYFEMPFADVGRKGKG